MKKGTIILTAIIATYLISCKKNAADAVSSSLDFQLAAVNPSSTVNRAMATITWSSGYANVNQIKFEYNFSACFYGIRIIYFSGISICYLKNKGG